MNHTADTSKDPETIRTEIDQTRERMDQTIDALADRVKGRHLLDELLGYFRSSNGMTKAREIKDQVAHSTGAALHSVSDSIKAHPMPVILIGAGVTWMIYESVKSTSNGGRGNGSHGIKGDGFSAPNYPAWNRKSQSESDPAALAGEYWGANEDDYKSAQEGDHGTAGGIKAKVGEVIHRVSDKVCDKAEHLRERSHEWSERAKQKSHELYDRSKQQVTQTVQSHPLSVGLGCLATGIIAGLLIPTPRRATEALRPQAQHLKERALEAGHELMDRGRHVADAAVDAFKEEAEHQGLTPEALKKKASAVVSHTTEAAKREGSSPSGSFPSNQQT